MDFQTDSMRLGFLLWTIFLSGAFAASSCGSKQLNVNATGSVDFQLPWADHDNHTWTLSTAISQERIVTPNDSVLSLTSQTYWLNTDPVIPTNGSAAPFYGCFIATQDFTGKGDETGTSNSADCAGFLSSNCYNDILDNLQGFVHSVASVSTLQQATQLCNEIANMPYPSECGASKDMESSSSG